MNEFKLSGDSKILSKITRFDQRFGLTKVIGTFYKLGV